MRRIARRYGASLAVSEMVAAKSLAGGDPESLARSASDGSGLHAVQIAGCRAEDLAEAARIAEGAGADLIDINMGCPAKKVTGGLAGSALMRDLDHATALIRATVAAVAVPVTVKMRLGWDDDTRNAPDLARRAEAEGVGMITVHGRTRAQFYSGSADWWAVRATVEAVRVPVVVNGDCCGPNEAERMLALSGACAVMIGRAAVGKPWLVGAVRRHLRGESPDPDPTPIERLALVAEHYEALLTSFGIAKGVRHARKHLAAYVEPFATDPNSDGWRRAMLVSDDPAEVLRLLAEIFRHADQESRSDVNTA